MSYVTGTCSVCGRPYLEPAGLPGPGTCPSRACNRVAMRRLREAQRRIRADVARMLKTEEAAGGVLAALALDLQAAKAGKTPSTEAASVTQKIDLSRQPIPPTVGRVVLFTPAYGEDKGQPYPAIVTHVHSDVCVNLAVMNDGSYPLQFAPGGSVYHHDGVVPVTSVEYDQEGAPGTWRWMGYQIGQAERTRHAEGELARARQESHPFDSVGTGAWEADAPVDEINGRPDAA